MVFTSVSIAVQVTSAAHEFVPADECGLAYSIMGVVSANSQSGRYNTIIPL